MSHLGCVPCYEEKVANCLVTNRLQQPWIYKDPPPVLIEASDGTQTPLEVAGSAVQSSNSSVSLGDTRVWRDVGDA